MNKPNAWIVASKDRGRKKIYRGKETGNRRVYLNDGDEFQIELHNPTTQTVLARIWMDGKSISNSGIIVKPGQRIYLERYLDEDKSFKYETYDVENTGGNRQAISSNGKLEVKFFNEYINMYNTGAIGIGIGWNNWDYTGNFYGTCTTNTGSGTFTTGNTSLTSGVSGTFTTPGVYNLQSDSQNYNSRTYPTPKKLKSKTRSKSTDDNLETGQVAKGKSTGQNLKYVDMDFNTYASTTVTYWLMPESRKVLTKGDLKKQYFYDGTKNSVPKDIEVKNKEVKYKPEYKVSESEKINIMYSALTQLKELKDNGLITEDEFSQKREQLMKENS